MSSTDSIRLSGLVSGFDTQAIIDQILAIDYAKIESLQEDKELTNAKIDTWNDLAAQLCTFAESVNTLKADGTSSNTLFDDKIVTSSSSTIATATAEYTADTGSLSVTVDKLAQAHSIYGQSLLKTWLSTTTGTFTINSTTISVTAGDSMDDIADAINDATYVSGKEVVAYVVEVSSTDERLVLQAASTGSDYAITMDDDPDNILDTDLNFINGSAWKNVAQAAQDAEIQLFGQADLIVSSSTNTFDDIIPGVTVSAIGTGSSTLTVSHNTEEIKTAITNFIDGYNETRDLISRIRSVTLDEDDEFGVFFSDSLMRSLYNDVRTMTTFNVAYGGEEWDGTITLDANIAVNDGSIQLTGFTSDGTLKAGDTFYVTNGDSDTTAYVLTANATVIAGDVTVYVHPPVAVANNTGTSVDVSNFTLEDFGVGISTDNVSATEGIIALTDEAILDAALANDTSANKNIASLKRLFTRNDANSERSASGVARRLYDFIDYQTKISYYLTRTRSIDDTKIDTLEDDIDDIDEQIARLEKRLADKEKVLIRQFSEMENAMSKANSVGSSLSSLSSSGSS